MLGKITEKYTVFALILTAIGSVALFFPLTLGAKAALAIGYFLGTGYLVGTRIVPHERRTWQVFFGFLATVSGLAVLGSIVYYVYRLDTGAVSFLLLTPLLLPLISLRRGKDVRLLFNASPALRPEPSAHRPTPLQLAATVVLALISAGLIAYDLAILTGATTDLSIRSPWDVVPRMFFVVFFMAALAVFSLALGGAFTQVSVAATAGLVFLTVSAAAIVYRVGFGFDPFIHQATESVIFKLGQINPKPLYYLGQYSLITIVARMLGGYVLEIDRWLVPVMIALTIPCAYYGLGRAFDWPPKIAAAASFIVLLLPLSSFIATTPQGLANSLLLMTAFLALPAAMKAGRDHDAEHVLPRSLLVLLALAVTAIHPLAGIPLVFFVGLLVFITSTRKSRGPHEVGRLLVLSEIALIGAVALPAVFLLNAAISHTDVSFNTELLRSPISIIEELTGSDIVDRRFMAAFDLVYFWRSVRETLLIIAGLLGAAVLVRRHRGVAAYIIGFFVFASNYILLKTVLRFSFLIDYERSNYADRLVELMLFLLAPLAAYALGRVLIAASRGPSPLRLGAAVVLTAFTASSLYLAYPRRDLYESSRGWSTSTADVDAVRLINKDSSGSDYVALADQSVSAAAIREFGFKKYYGGIFYYPVPTGDALYKKFLDMNDSMGAAKTAREVMDMTGADTVYFVVTNYWWHAQRIIVSAKRQADKWWNVSDTDYVFKYVRPRTCPGNCVP